MDLGKHILKRAKVLCVVMLLVVVAAGAWMGVKATRINISETKKVQVDLPFLESLTRHFLVLTNN